MNIARRKLKEACRGRAQAHIAQEVGVSASFISAVLRGDKLPGHKVLAYLGLEAFESYRPLRSVRRGNASQSDRNPVKPIAVQPEP